MALRRTPSSGRSSRGRQREQELDLRRIDAFLTKGVDDLDQDEEDPVAAMKPQRPQPPSAVAAGPPLPAPAPKLVTPPPRDAVQVGLSPDRLEALVTVRPKQAAGIGVAEVLQALTQAGISYGIDEDAVVELVEQLPATTQPELSVTVARGTPVVAGRNVRVTVPGLQEEPLAAEELASFEAAGGRLAQALSSATPERVSEGVAGLPLLLPGEVAVRLTPAEPGLPGMDVCGRELLPPPVVAELPVPGEGLRTTDTEGEWVAQRTGYLQLHQGRISLVPPVWVTADEMAVYGLHLAPPNRALDVEILAQGLQQTGIAAPPERAILAAQLHRAGNGSCALLLSSGVPPEPGQDGRMEMQVTVGAQAGKVLPDGSIDFKSRGFGAGVEPDTLLAVVQPPQAGRAGATVTGRELPTTGGQPAALTAGTGVEAVAEGEVIRFYARATGCVRRQGQVLEVTPLLAVPGDVDYTTGNLDFRGDLVVDGGVRGGFEAKATGDVTIAQGLENGALVKSGGRVTVGKGIFGGKTKVVALKGIQAQFVHDASLVCRGDVEVGSYIHHAKVRAGGQVTVQGRGERSGIAGGEVCATTGIHTPSAGSAGATTTRLIAGVDLELARSLQKLEQGLEFCRTNVAKLMAALRVDSPEPRVLGQAVNRFAPAQRDRMRLLARKLEELARMAATLEEQREELQTRQRQVAQEAWVRVDGTIHAGVDIFIGTTHRRTSTSVKRVVFRLTENGKIEGVPA